MGMGDRMGEIGCWVMGWFCLERERKARECGQGGTYKEKGKAGKLKNKKLG